jgi:hypothetical protein
MACLDADLDVPCCTRAPTCMKEHDKDGNKLCWKCTSCTHGHPASGALCLLRAGCSAQRCVHLLPEAWANPEVQNRNPGPQTRGLCTGPRPPPPPPARVPGAMKLPAGAPSPPRGPWNPMGICPFPKSGSKKSGSAKNHRLARARGDPRHPKHPLSTRNEHGKAECHEDASPRVRKNRCTHPDPGRRACTNTTGTAVLLVPSVYVRGASAPVLCCERKSKSYSSIGFEMGMSNTMPALQRTVL